MITAIYLYAYNPTTWMLELQHFIIKLSENGVQQPVNDINDKLCMAAIRTVGGIAAGVALWDNNKQNFI